MSQFIYDSTAYAYLEHAAALIPVHDCLELQPGIGKKSGGEMQIETSRSEQTIQIELEQSKTSRLKQADQSMQIRISKPKQADLAFGMRQMTVL